jgi:tripeptidyl-peptidase-1
MIKYSTSLLYPQTVILYQTDDDIYEPQEVATTNLFNTFLDGETGDNPEIYPVYPHDAPGGYTGQLQCGIYKPANVISGSYGQAEADFLPHIYAVNATSS